jgi:hypothetical protein
MAQGGSGAQRAGLPLDQGGSGAPPATPPAEGARKPAGQTLASPVVLRRGALFLGLAVLLAVMTIAGIVLSLWLIPAVLRGQSDPTRTLPASQSVTTITPLVDRQGAGLVEPTVTPTREKTAPPNALMTAAAQEVARQTATVAVQQTRTEEARVEQDQSATRQVMETEAVHLGLLEEARKLWSLETLDTFGNNQNGWHVGFGNDEWSVDTTSIQDGQYRRDLKANQSVLNRSWVAFAPTDFLVSVDIEIQERQVANGRPEASLVLRSSSDGYYIFALSQAGSYTFQKYDQAQAAWTAILDYTPTPVFKPQGPNHLAVITQGSRFTLFLNGRFVGQVTDDQFPTGKLGLGAALFTKDDQAIFVYDNFELRVP